MALKAMAIEQMSERHLKFPFLKVHMLKKNSKKKEYNAKIFKNQNWGQNIFSGIKKHNYSLPGLFYFISF